MVRDRLSISRAVCYVVQMLVVTNIWPSLGGAALGEQAFQGQSGVESSLRPCFAWKGAPAA